MKLEADQAVDGAVEALRAAKVQLAFLLGVRGRVPDYKVDQDLPKFFVPSPLASATADSLVADGHRSSPGPEGAGLPARPRAGGRRAGQARALPRPQPQRAVLAAGGHDQRPRSRRRCRSASSARCRCSISSRARSKKAEADYRTQQLQRAKVQAQLVADVEGAYNAFVSSRKLVERMEGRLLDRVKRARDLVSLQYQKGAASLLEYLDAQRTFIADQRRVLAGPRRTTGPPSISSKRRSGWIYDEASGSPACSSPRAGAAATTPTRPRSRQPPAGEAWLTPQQVKNANLRGAAGRRSRRRRRGGRPAARSRSTTCASSHVFSPVTGPHRAHRRAAGRARQEGRGAGGHRVARRRHRVLRPGQGARRSRGGRARLRAAEGSVRRARRLAEGLRERARQLPEGQGRALARAEEGAAARPRAAAPTRSRRSTRCARTSTARSSRAT